MTSAQVSSTEGPRGANFVAPGAGYAGLRQTAIEAAMTVQPNPRRIVRLLPSDSARYNAYFGEGARLHPRTLRISPEDVEAQPFVIEAGEGGATLAAVNEAGEWLGVGTVERERGRTKRAHIA